MGSWKRVAAALSAAALGFAMTAAIAAPPVEITFRFNDPGRRRCGRRSTRSRSANPGIKVTLERMAWKDARDQFLREAAVGEGPDVVHIAFVWAKEMGQAGALLPLDDLVRGRPPAQGLADFIATDLATGSKDGKLYALPWTTDTWAMVYRTDLLKRAGVSGLPATWDDLKAPAARSVPRPASPASAFRPAAPPRAASGSSPITSGGPTERLSWPRTAIVQGRGSRTRTLPDRCATSRATSTRATRRNRCSVSAMGGPGHHPRPRRRRRRDRGDASGNVQPSDRGLCRRPSGGTGSVYLGPDPERHHGGTSHLGGRMLGINAAPSTRQRPGSSSSS